MPSWISPKEGATRFRALPKLMEREIVNGMRRSTHFWRRKSFEIFSRRGLGRVFGESAVLGTANQRANTRQARVIIKREPVRKSGNGQYTTGLRLRGFAALTEAGGQTRPHEIKARDGGVLGKPPDGVGRDSRGRPIYARRVFQRLGARIKKTPFVEDAGRQSEPEFIRQQEIAAQRSIELAKLAA